MSEATAESQFPDGIVFRVAAESPGIIDDVRVFFRKADQSGRSAYRSIEVEPGENVTGETLLPASGGADYFPPGTKITYHFEVWDKAGDVMRTEETEFVYLDNRFHWLTLSDDLITVYYYSEYVEERAQDYPRGRPADHGQHGAGAGHYPHRAAADCDLQQLPPHVHGPALPVAGRQTRSCRPRVWPSPTSGCC